MKEQLRYGTWIRMKKISIYWALAALFLLAAVLAIVNPWFLLLLVPGLIFAYIAITVTLTHWRLSPQGGDYQNKIHDVILAHKGTPGDTADIGCGSGNLIIKAARADRESSHLGLDFWGEDWEYSLGQCQTNARIEGVGNVGFVKASAAQTGLESGRYHCVVSCLTFHEVRDQPNKSALVAEALRILKPGGTYVFLDLFDDTRHYPPLQDILKTIELSGCSVDANAPLSELIPLPFPLNEKNALKYARLLSGQKFAAP